MCAENIQKKLFIFLHIYELQEAVRHDPNFLSRVITGDESWVYDYDPETKQQSTQWKRHPLRDRKKRAKFAATSSQC